MKGKCFTTCFTDLDISSGQMEGSIKETGTKIRCREMASTLGRMDRSTQVSICKTKSMGMVSSLT